MIPDRRRRSAIKIPLITFVMRADYVIGRYITIMVVVNRSAAKIIGERM